MIKITVNGYNYTPKFSTFPGGEEYVKLINRMPQDPSNIVVHAHIDSSTELMRLMLLKDALERYAYHRSCHYTLNLPYLPYARQDRVCAEGESFSLKVACAMINAMGFDRVDVNDCHSDVGLALLDNVHHIDQLTGFRTHPSIHNVLHDSDVIIAPDAGAAKKAKAIADYYNKPLVQCLKTRVDKDTVQIRILGDVQDKRAVVVDDICDGGGTFLALAAAIEVNKPKTLELCVTHGIFSRGKVALEDKAYDAVYGVYDWEEDDGIFE